MSGWSSYLARAISRALTVRKDKGSERISFWLVERERRVIPRWHGQEPRTAAGLQSLVSLLQSVILRKEERERERALLFLTAGTGQQPLDLHAGSTN